MMLDESPAGRAYHEGQCARLKGFTPEDVPYGVEQSRFKAPIVEREQSQRCLRHWWLAGWHDEDMECRRRASVGRLSDG